MSEKIIIALDGMGGDKAPFIVIYGAAIAAERLPHVHFLITGDEPTLSALVKKYGQLEGRVEYIHTDKVIKAEDKPSRALRTGRNSSMGEAIGAVRDGRAMAMVSAGNTGALMALSMFMLKKLPGVLRPAISTVIPTDSGETCMLDLGANLEADAAQLVQFAVMGIVFAHTVMGLEKPILGLLNVGVEELKGHSEIREAANILKTREEALNFSFKGFVEGDSISLGNTDLIITDGFSGNIALKTMEGTIKVVQRYVKRQFKSSLLASIGYLFARRALQKLKVRIDVRRYNGAVFMGINGIVIKSHGGTDSLGFSHAIEVAVNMANADVNTKIMNGMKQIQEIQQ